ncbi:type VI secretion protein [Altererythrobacter soli]|uniref:Type VI secretion protein n=1 Tax=Croceibacterium soli TaxID=1739690 RepID=A0A6I4USI3_9SPHN|nr:TrbI/VirB10 family protein [Croceibacterium soli]MXP41598.1 type VI secretion protein [Croceibacterium soli]
MKLAMRLAAKPAIAEENDRDPRESETAEIIDLASRTAYPVVSQRKGKSDALGLAAGVGVVALLGAATLWGMNATRTEQAAPQAQQPAQQQQPAQAPVPLAEQPQPAPAQTVAPQPDPAPAPVLAAPPQTNLAPAGNPYSSPTVVFDAGGLPSLAVPAAPGTEAATGNNANDFASRIGGVGGGPAQARVDVDPKTTVTQGTMIPAILETAINTDVPGYARAVVSQDVRSFDGTRILVPRSSRLIGQYQSGLQGGQKRAYVIWTRLIRPDGVSVNLASPATGFDGSTGLEGKVNSHFFQRFGSAMLLSVIGGLSTLGTGGAGVILGGGQSAAAAAVQQGNNISPTVRVRQGEPIRVFTARDLDFSRAPRL